MACQGDRSSEAVDSTDYCSTDFESQQAQPRGAVADQREALGSRCSCRTRFKARVGTASRLARFQRRGDASNRCVLGCRGAAEDSIEHYCCCSVVRSVARSFLFIDGADRHGIQEFMFADHRILSRDDLVRRAVSVYAAWMGTNDYQNRGPTVLSTSKEALLQHDPQGK